MKRITPLKYPCLTCKEEIELRIDKRHKPYCICDRCGVQSFIRKASGVRKLAENLEIELNDDGPELSKDKNVIINFSQLITLISKYNQLIQKLEEIERKEDLTSMNESTEKEIISIEKEIENIRVQITKLTKNSLI